jgi:predicted MPP superfamily phosphohydrolase
MASIAAAIFVFLGLNLYLGWNGHLFWETAFPSVRAGWFWAVYWIFALSYLAAALLRNFLPYRAGAVLKVIGSYGLGLLFYSLILIPLADIAAWVMRLSGVEREQSILISGWTVVALLALVFLIGSYNAWNTVIRSYELVVPKSAGDGRRELRIAVASDLHLGAVVGKKQLARLADSMDELKPDLILLAGDVLDDSIEPFIKENMADVMQRLKAPLGVFACLGNHEYIGGHVGEYIKRMQAIGIEVLTDKVVEIGSSFYVAGRKDRAEEHSPQGGRLSVEQLLDEADRTKPVILLDHQPYGLAAASAAGVDLMLSGHTHRGQMAPAHLVTRKLFELDWGYLRKGAMHVIVSSGYGLWGPPVRLGSRSEIIDIKLKFA